MKRTIISTVLFAIMALSFTGCGGDDIEVTGISLDQATLQVPVESTGALIATLEPEGAKGDVQWSSSDPSVAAVNNGIVTGLKQGTATVAASFGIFSATCEVTVTPKQLDPNNLPASLKGSNYHIIQIDETSYGYIQNKVVNDFRPDDNFKNLWVWEATFLGGTPSGLNFYGMTEGWVSLVVSNVGWSGAGYNVAAGFGDINMTDLYANPNDYVFHIALKSAQPSSSYLFIFTDKTSEAKVCIGSAAIEGIEPYMDFTRDNEWHSIEIPVSYLNTLGLFYNAAFSDVNILAFLAGGVQGTTLDMDAVFFYKKAE